MHAIHIRKQLFGIVCPIVLLSLHLKIMQNSRIHSSLRCSFKTRYSHLFSSSYVVQFNGTIKGARYEVDAILFRLSFFMIACMMQASSFVDVF